MPVGYFSKETQYLLTEDEWLRNTWSLHTVSFNIFIPLLVEKTPKIIQNAVLNTYNKTSPMNLWESRGKYLHPGRYDSITPRHISYNGRKYTVFLFFPITPASTKNVVHIRNSCNGTELYLSRNHKWEEYVLGCLRFSKTDTALIEHLPHANLRRLLSRTVKGWQPWVLQAGFWMPVPGLICNELTCQKLFWGYFLTPISSDNQEHKHQHSMMPLLLVWVWTLFCKTGEHYQPHIQSYAKKKAFFWKCYAQTGYF